MLKPLHCQLHEPGDQQGKAIGGQKKAGSGGIAPPERLKICGKARKFFKHENYRDASSELNISPNSPAVYGFATAPQKPYFLKSDMIGSLE